MGLDMYAHKRHYVKQWDHQKPEERYTVRVEYGGKPAAGIRADRISSVEEEVMYWRKANHIHAWFVHNVQNGVDDCRKYMVSDDDIRELHRVCYEVLQASNLVEGMVYNGTVHDKNHPKGLVQRTAGKVIEDATVAKKLLPTQTGFFFGHTEYDEYYLDDVIETLNWCLRMLEERNAGAPGDIYYSSSW